MPSVDQITAAVTAYGAAFAARDRDAFLACFSADAVQVDPKPAPANVGHEAIGAFYDGAMNMAPDISLYVDRIIVCAEQAAVDFRVEATMGGTAMGFSGIDIFTVNDDGKISALTAYWDPATIAPR